MSDGQAMQAIVIETAGGPEVLKPQTMPRPSPAHGELLIEVHAAGVNRPDVMQRAGLYPPPAGAPHWPGLEVAGIVAEAGEGVTRWKVGDRVTALLAGGGYAEYAVAPQETVMPVPQGYSFVEAAAVPETFMTVWHNVFQRGALTAGETLLVHGGTSGIGTTAIQLAVAMGARAITTVGSADKAKVARDLGAELAVNYREADFVEAVREHTGGRGADVILDMVGGDYVGRNIVAAADDGRIVQIATMKGHKVEINAGLVMRKRLTLTGSTLRPRDLGFKGALARELVERVWPLLEARKVAPLIDVVLPLEEAAEAHRAMDADHVGKIMLTTAKGRAAG
jgi:NADPH:quinone reductase